LSPNQRPCYRRELKYNHYSKKGGSSTHTYEEREKEKTRTKRKGSKDLPRRVRAGEKG